jgi:hypothetical protein
MLSICCRSVPRTVHRRSLDRPFEPEGERMQSDLDYFRGRAREEIDASLSAQSTVARKAHLELAHRYSELAEAIERSGWPYRDPSQG